MSTPLGHVLYEPKAPITHVYFPLEGMVSLVLTAGDGATLEAGVVGNEGAIGIPLFLGAERSPAKAFFQTPGECLRIGAEPFRAAVERGGQLAFMLKRYTHAMFVQLSQSVLCNRLHSIEERMARWILTTHDRLGSDVLNLTQEFVAQMLGVRRPSVTVVAGVLQQAGLIRYARGRIAVLDRARLEDASCECYGVVRAEFERALSGDGASPD
jgi:CRP-like cAMP-binding protein